MGRARRLAVQQWWLCVVAVSVLAAVLVQSRAQPAPPSADESLVLTTDEVLGAAMRAGDRSTARRLLSLQFSFVDADGELHERKDFLADLKSLAAGAATDTAVRVYGRIATVTGSRKSARGTDVFFLDIWAKQKGAWRALLAQDVVLSEAKRPADQPPVPAFLAEVFDCKNPCETIPYRVRSAAEQDIVNTFQVIEKARAAHDADEYAKHITDDFAHYESDSAPILRPEAIARIAVKKNKNIPAIITAIQSMRLWVYGDGAAMISANGVRDDTEPLLRVARVWVKRNGQWQMAISMQTEVKASP